MPDPVLLDIGGAMAYHYGSFMLLNKSNRYARLSIDVIEASSAALDQLGAGMKTWMSQLALKIASRLK